MAFGDFLLPDSGQQQPIVPAQTPAPTAAVAQAPVSNEQVNASAQGWFAELKKVQEQPEFANALMVFGNALERGESIGTAAAQVSAYRSAIDTQLQEDDIAEQARGLETRKVERAEKATEATIEGSRLDREQRGRLADQKQKALQARYKVTDTASQRNYALQYGKVVGDLYTKAVKAVDKSLEFAEGSPEEIAALRTQRVEAIMKDITSKLPKAPGTTTAETVAATSVPADDKAVKAQGEAIIKEQSAASETVETIGKYTGTDLFDRIAEVSVYPANKFAAWLKDDTVPKEEKILARKARAEKKKSKESRRTSANRVGSATATSGNPSFEEYKAAVEKQNPEAFSDEALQQAYARDYGE